MQTNQTHASGKILPLYTHQSIIRLFLPLLMEQFLAVTIGMADTLMVSSVGEAAISGVSLVDTVNTLILQVLAALATGGAVVASQYLGRGDKTNARKGASQLYACLIMATGAAALLSVVFCRPILRMVFGSIDEQVMKYATTYFFISAFSFPFMGIYNAGAALFRAQGNSRISMFASLVMNVINIGLNAVFIFVFRLGVMGAALASMIARIFAAVWVTCQLQRPENIMRIEGLKALTPDSAYIHRILKIGIPSGLENGVFHIGKILVSSLISTLGTTAIAANAVVNVLASMANIPGNAVSLAMIPVIGRCIGAGRKDEARSCAGFLMKMAYAGIIATNIVLFAGIPVFARWFSLSDAAHALAVQVTRTYNIVGVLIWPSSFTLPNVLRAGGDAKYTMLVSLVSMWVFRVLLCYLFVLGFGMGLQGVWFGMYVDWLCRTVLFALRYRSGKWMENQVI